MSYPVSQAYRATSYSDRVYFLILHYTDCPFAQALELLLHTHSSHYLIPEPHDTSYPHDTLQIFNLVDEGARAWHAGESCWGARTDLNAQSIGIELVYVPQAPDTWPDYHPQQIEALVQLCQQILARHRHIGPTHVLAHSDIAPARKRDPGPRFPWHQLHLAGIGAWYDSQTEAALRARYTEAGLPSNDRVRSWFKRYGYPVERVALADIVRAFQLHFRPSCCDGQLDAQTCAILHALIDRYFPDVN